MLLVTLFPPATWLSSFYLLEHEATDKIYV